MARPFTVIGFTLFFALALIFEAGQKAAIVLISAAVAAFVFSIFFKSARRDFVVPVAAVTVIIAVLLSFSAGLVPAEASELYADGVHSVRASVVSLEEQKYGRFYTQIKTSEIDGEPYEINLRLSSKESLDAEPYDIVEGSFQLYDLGQTEDARNYYLSENVFMGCYSKGEISVSKPDKRPLGYYPLAMRAKIKISLSQLMPGEKGALATALLIGDKSQLPKSISSAFSAAGISHLIAVSGLHLSIWCLFILKIFDLFHLRGRAGTLLSAAFVVIFMAVSGFTYSVMRSGFMMLVMLLGRLISKQSDSLNSLGIALTVLCFVNPYCVMSLGLRLSFLSTLGIIAGFGNLNFPLDGAISRLNNRYLRSIAGLFFGSVRSTALACAFTLPVMILDLKKISLLSIPSNLILNIPASVCMILSGLAVLTSLTVRLSVLTAAFSDIAGVCASFVIKTAKSLSALPYSTINASSIVFSLWLIFALTVLAAAVLIYRFAKKNGIRAAVLICAVTFAATCAGSFAFSRMTTSITVVDVGNGSAVVVSSGGKTALLGCGGDSYFALSNIESALENAGEGSLDLLLIPRISEAESSLALDVIDSFSPEYILAGETDADLSSILKIENYSLAPHAQIQLGDAMLRYDTTENLSTAVLQTDGADVFIVFKPSGVSVGENEKDILILRENLPRGVAPAEYKLTVLSADESRSQTVMGKLISLGANAYATAGQGSIKLTVLPSGEILTERME